MQRLALRRAVGALPRAACSAPARGLCAPIVPLSEEVTSELAMMKEKAAGSVASTGYTADTFKAALASNSVDPSLLSSTLDFSEDAKKMAMRLNMQMAVMQKEMAEPMATDFASFAGKVDPAIIAEVKAIFDAELAAAEAATSDEAFTEVEKKVSSIFSGPDGLFELASKEEKAAKAGMAQCIADMETLAVDIEGVSNVTIGEILDREPELRAEIEEEIKNNVWAP